MSSRKLDCFFLDACILLPQKQRRYAEACADFLKEAGSKCYVSSSVKKTTLAILDDAYDWIVKHIQSALFPYMTKANIKKVTCRNGLAFEAFFDESRRELRAVGSPYIYYEIVGQIEHWTVSHVRGLQKGLRVKPENFLAGITFELSRIYEKLKSPIEAIEDKPIAPSDEVKSQVALRKIMKIEDIIHLASAIEYQFINNVWIVFVTYDEEHILSHKGDLWGFCALRCSKPTYASEYLVTFSRMKKPIQYYLNIPKYSPQQIAFGKAIEKTLNIKIIR